MTKPTIELSESVFKKIQVLSPENQKQILDFLEFITANSDETQEKKQLEFQDCIKDKAG
ncbi:hypothetical protein NON20_20670 [Synechocystis sp. B12]|nr:hypothetical protein NON20_20670 [Synechocystis sp. B12]